jgi:hypothetical protein
VVLYCLEIGLGVTYREVIDWPEGGVAPPASPELKKVPLFPMVQKAFQRLSTAVWRVLQRLSASLLQGDGVAAVDFGGWDRFHAGRHYTTSEA